MANYSRDQAVTRIAGRQRDLLITAQLSECGLDKDAVARRVRAGWLRLVFQGVYSVGSGELTPLAREQAALMSCGERRFISHQSAAFVWGMRKAPPGLVEVRYSKSVILRKGMRVHRILAVHRRELRRHEGSG